MPKDLDPKATVNIPCPKCGHKQQATVGALEYSPPFRCPACGAAFSINVRKLFDKLREAEKKAEEARRRGAQPGA